MKIIFKKEKGWPHALGLHHVAATVGFITVGHLFGLGDYMAVFSIGWYLSREYKEFHDRRGGEFEIMDFLSPALTATLYLIS